MPHPILPQPGTYIVRKGEPLPDWFRVYMSAPWAVARNFMITVASFGGVSIEPIGIALVPVGSDAFGIRAQVGPHWATLVSRA